MDKTTEALDLDKLEALAKAMLNAKSVAGAIAAQSIFADAACPATILTLIAQARASMPVQAAPSIKTWQERTAGEELNGSTTFTAMKAEIADLRAALAAKAQQAAPTGQKEGVTEQDAKRLDFLDTNVHRFRMGWRVGAAPVGNLSMQSIIMGGLPIREAIDAAMSAVAPAVDTTKEKA